MRTRACSSPSPAFHHRCQVPGATVSCSPTASVRSSPSSTNVDPSRISTCSARWFRAHARRQGQTRPPRRPSRRRRRRHRLLGGLDDHGLLAGQRVPDDIAHAHRQDPAVAPSIVRRSSLASLTSDGRDGPFPNLSPILLSCCLWRGRAARTSSSAAGSWSSWTRRGPRRHATTRCAQAIAPDPRHRRALDHRGQRAQGGVARGEPGVAPS
jgi:hypothetical protein